MCKASSYIAEIESIVARMSKDQERLSKAQSKYDSMISELYHKIECMNFNACEGFYLSKQLQELLRKRRVVKDEISRLNTLNQTLGYKNMAKSIDKSKACISKAKNKSAEWQHDWKYTYSLEEVLH